jgi:type II secretory ATPase GspE/PulE/Tfp pilus assembly ATPase PilB-like protein
MLRQDPDIIMVGEIRDTETVDIAIRAAITGHLVLSTIHTNDAAGTITRLVDMGVAPYLLSASLAGIIAQRLVRKICPRCRTEYTPSEYQLEVAKLPGYKGKFVKGSGCSLCNNTGHKGRIAIYEILEIDKNIRNLIIDATNSDLIREVAVKNGMSTLFNEVQKRVISGITSYEEMMRVAFSQDD